MFISCSSLCQIIHISQILFKLFDIKAKVLLSTSRHEGFANVYSQAAALGCFIVSTDVGGADVCSNNWNYGVKLCQEDSDGLAKVIYDIVNDNLNMNKIM